MKLEKIKIVNFRSIADIEIKTEPTCQGFVGINESGKSNILKAISLLSEEADLEEDDIRIETYDEEIEQDSYVKFSFKLSKDEMTNIIDNFLSTIYFEQKSIKITFETTTKTLKEFLLDQDNGVYICDIKENSRQSNYFALSKSEIVPVTMLVKPRHSEGKFITRKEGEIEFSNYSLYAKSSIKETDLTLFEECTSEDLNNLFGNLVAVYIPAHIPNVVYWKYEEKNLLNKSVNLDKFIANPASCVPLQSMFYLAGYDNIEEKLSSAKQNPRPNAMINILKKVAGKSTEYLHSVWKSYRDIKFELSKDGSEINIFIKDVHNRYDCEQRSDGFKRFITFLLSLSVRVKNGEIENSIIVIDEPDIGIHIAGQRDLLRDLIKISRKNLVFYSTHSIFMIDRQLPHRHFIVKKKDEITNIKQVDVSRPTDDEVINNALGYSVFEVLKKFNLLFEGWSDKKVFEVASKTTKGKRIRNFDDIGRVHSTGVKRIICLAKTLELANREYIVISDSDKPAKDKNKIFLEEEKCVGRWYKYDDFVNDIITLEDFIKNTSLIKSLKHVCREFEWVNSFDDKAFEKITNKKEACIISFLYTYLGGKQEKVNLIKKDIKNHLYSNIKLSDIEDTYYDFLTKLSERIEETKPIA